MNSLQQVPHWRFILSLLSTVVDLTLSGDNAVVIAGVATSLPPESSAMHAASFLKAMWSSSLPAE
jgi:predicted tellurium resistance membrane protein TerC